jgi:hypothetical protein
MPICPCCHIDYDTDNTDMLDHINDCDGKKDIICTRWYTHEELYKMHHKKNNNKEKIITSTVIKKRPSTR